MRLYYAAAESSLDALSLNGVNDLLISFANGKNKIPIVPSKFDCYDLIIDSGAFTYQKKGGIDIDRWIDGIKSVRCDNSHIISLDVIGDAERSYHNYIYIKDAFDSIPTFHVGSDIKYLKSYLQYTDRIAIGGMVNYKSSIGALRGYLDEIFELFDVGNLPKFHAFGYFSQQILQDYPFYSCDASTWQNYARFGEFHTFRRFQYKRVKSLKVERINPRKLPIKDLTALRLNDADIKLRRIVRALTKYKNYITNIWTQRGVTW